MQAHPKKVWFVKSGQNLWKSWENRWTSRKKWRPTLFDYKKWHPTFAEKYKNFFVEVIQKEGLMIFVGKFLDKFAEKCFREVWENPGKVSSHRQRFACSCTYASCTDTSCDVFLFLRPSKLWRKLHEFGKQKHGLVFSNTGNRHLNCFTDLVAADKHRKFRCDSCGKFENFRPTLCLVNASPFLLQRWRQAVWMTYWSFGSLPP